MKIITSTNKDNANDYALFHSACFDRLVEHHSHYDYRFTNEDWFVIEKDDFILGERCSQCDKSFTEDKKC